MADPVVKIELTNLQAQWIRKSVLTQRNVLMRSLSKEMAGSDIHRLRQEEIRALDALAAKIGV